MHAFSPFFFFFSEVSLFCYAVRRALSISLFSKATAALLSEAFGESGGAKRTKTMRRRRRRKEEKTSSWKRFGNGHTPRIEAVQRKFVVVFHYRKRKLSCSILKKKEQKRWKISKFTEFGMSLELQRIYGVVFVSQVFGNCVFSNSFSNYSRDKAIISIIFWRFNQTLHN